MYINYDDVIDPDNVIGIVVNGVEISLQTEKIPPGSVSGGILVMPDQTVATSSPSWISTVIVESGAMSSDIIFFATRVSTFDCMNLLSGRAP